MKIAAQPNTKAANVIGTSEPAHIPLDLLANHPQVPHRQLDKTHVEELYNSIKKSGLDTALIVWGGEKPGSKMRVKETLYPMSFLVAGAHRREALRMLKKHDAERYAELFPKGVPCTLRVCPLSEAICILLRENVDRKDMAPEQVLPYMQQLQKMGLKGNVIASRIGKSTAWVSMILDITKNLGDEGVEEVAKGGVSMREARKASKDVKSGKSTPKDAIAKAKLKKGGKKRAAKRVGIKALYDRYSALPGSRVTNGLRIQILEGLIEYVIGDNDEIPELLQEEASEE
jgi:ParB-like chromosome segregation protein Spo0J